MATNKNNTLEQIMAAMSAAKTAPDKRTQTNNAATFEQLLQQITGKFGSGDDFVSFLNGLGITDFKALDLSQRQDWNKQILDTLLNQLLTNENRQYNEAMRDEQRGYDSPMAQLARLMGTGMSRDAALAALQGGQQPIGSDPAAAGEGVSPSQSSLNQAQSFASSVDAVAGLASLGLSIPASIQQVKALSLQNSMTQSQVDAFKSTGKAFSILHAANVGSDAFGSVASVSDALTGLANSGNADAQQFIQSGGLKSMQENASFSSHALASLYKSERESQDYDTSFGKFVELQNADIDFKRADKRRVEQQILNLGAEFEEVQARTEFVQSETAMQEYHKKMINAQVEYLRKQGRQIEADILLKNSATALNRSRTKEVDLSNALTEGIYNAKVDGKSGLDWLVSGRATDAYNDCQKFVSAKDRKIWKKELDAIASDYDRLYTLNLLRVAYQSGALQKYNSDSNFADLMNVCTAMHESGAWSYIDAEMQKYGEFIEGSVYDAVVTDPLEEFVEPKKRR